MALTIIALSLVCLTCQKSGQSSGEGAGANSANTPAGGQTSATSQPQTNSASQPPVAPQTQLKVGDRAPDFELTDTEGQTVRLSDFRGKKNVVLAFYVLAFTGG
jgi:cytochrome oxidase Cu insertion factor (SCO1/SenC/PrrC family)